MRRVVLGMLIILGFISLLASVVQAVPIVMKGNYIYTQISDDGTLGDDDNYPGIQYDPTGSGSFPGSGGKDFLQPGIPWEIFAVESDQTGLVKNSNSSSIDAILGTLTDMSASSSYDFYVRWNGSYGSYFDIVIDTYFNKDDKFIMFTTTITAQTDLTNLKFLRAIDPDQDYNDYGEFDTNNARGYGSILPEDWVYASGPYSNWTIGLYSNSSFTHNTGVSNWSSYPDDYLTGNNDGNGDYTIGVAFNLGDLSAGSSVTFDYAYVLGESPTDAASNIPPGGAPVPEPCTMLLLGSGLLGLAGIRKKKK